MYRSLERMYRSLKSLDFIAVSLSLKKGQNCIQKVYFNINVYNVCICVYVFI